ncbi:hypothetical protein BD626DRAFT_460386 [Schizophyllum amplum]|uniref:ATP-grasp domain-containing protein n=1 Tax=Schizophyllum amplum TaxID=97359 RepID=A0A550C8L5_9AGAR|nr:hypothetical protein BD626DRAFT_460386 [Auriculariopsis ampla]
MTLNCLPYPVNFAFLDGRKQQPERPLRILLSNGRFPVTLDLARQLRRAGHEVYCVDAMQYHVCKFSNAVRQCWQVPSPRVDASAYLEGVKNAIEKVDIDLIVPMHEEIIYLVECNDEEIYRRLFAPPLHILLRMHNKWEFTEWMRTIGLDAPEAYLCKSYEDVEKVPNQEKKEYALKPVFGRASQNVFHLKPGKPLPDRAELDVSDNCHWIAQEWLKGDRYCSYGIVRQGHVKALSLYSVTETIDGSSCVYFKSIHHPRIQAYMDHIAKQLPTTTGKLAFDFIETPDGRLVAIECNPRATSGVHLFGATTRLANVLTDPFAFPVQADVGAARQIMPGMLMWDRKQAHGLRAYVKHQQRLIGSKDVVFSMRDLLPTLMQPFLLTSYYEICRERKLKLPDMFQWDCTWEPEGEKLARVRRVMEEDRNEWKKCPMLDVAKPDPRRIEDETAEKKDGKKRLAPLPPGYLTDKMDIASSSTAKVDNCDASGSEDSQLAK